MSNQKPHILFLPRWYPNKTDVQLGIFIQQQAQLMAPLFKITVIYVQMIDNQKDTYDIQDEIHKDVREIRIYFKAGQGVFKKIINAKRYKQAQKLGHALIHEKIALCHVHVPYRPAFLALDLLNQKQIPFVITEHWSGHLTGAFESKNAVDKKLYKKVLAKAKSISCVSQLLADRFEKNTGFKSFVIPNFIKRNDFNVSMDAKKTIEILSVSDLVDKTKNITGLIHAFKEAYTQNSALRLTIVGGGPDELIIKSQLQNLQLEKVVTLPGRQAHDFVLEAYKKCDFYICNSNFETFGMAVAEALSTGKPVVSTQCGGPQEFLNERNSLIANPSNLTSQILLMANNFGQYRSEEIINEIEQKFGYNAVQQKWHAFYQQALT